MMTVHEQERMHDECSPLSSHAICRGARKLHHISEDVVEKVIGEIKCHKEKGQAAQKLSDPIEAIEEVMRQRGLAKKDLKPCIGSSGNVCDILKRRRPLSLKMIRNLHSFLGISAEVLIQPYMAQK